MSRNTINIHKPRWMLLCAVTLLCCTTWLPCAGAEQTQWKAGVASVVITPTEPMWMAGYAARKGPSDGKIHDLWAKAMALEDAQGTRFVLVTVDLIGIPRPTRDWMEKQVNARFKLPPAALLLNASHTHCGPVVRETRYSIYGNTLYGLSPEQIEQSNQYVDDLQEKLLRLIGKALDNLAPARLGYTHARAGFAMNRRSKTETTLGTRRRCEKSACRRYQDGKENGWNLSIALFLAP